MTRNVLIGTIVAILIVACGWWYLNQSSILAPPEMMQQATDGTVPATNTQTTQQQKTGTPQSSAQMQPNGSAATEKYTNTEYGISFSHPRDWECKTSRTHIDYPNWYQTTCGHTATFSGDPLVVISVPFVAGDNERWVKIRESNVVGHDSSVITKTVYRSGGFEGSIGLVDYVFSGSATMKGYNLFALYGINKPYATAEETEQVLDHVVQSLIIE